MAVKQVLFKAARKWRRDDGVCMCVRARTRADRPLVPILSNNIPNWGFPDLETANFLSLSRAQHNATVITAAK